MRTPSARPALRIDPEERAAAAEVAEGARRVALPVQCGDFVVAQLEAEAPVVRVEAAEVRQDAGEARELHRRRLGERLRGDERRALQLAREREQVVERAVQLGRRRATQLGAAIPSGWSTPAAR